MMALGTGIPPELAALLGEGQPNTSAADPRTAVIEALQNAMGKRSMMTQPMRPDFGGDSGIGNAVGGAIDMMTPRGQQPNYNYTGQDPYVKFPEGGVPEPYRPDSDMNPEPPNFRSEKYAQRDTGSRVDSIDAGEGSYDRSPGEDKAARMAQDAVEGKGITYPSKSGNEMLRDATRRGGGDPNGDWEGSPDGVPTKGDLEAVQESPTDGNLASFFRAFPKYTMEDVMMRGGNPSGSPDEYAMSDEDFQRLNRRRRTTIENR
jgi:hypothetical protein